MKGFLKFVGIIFAFFAAVVGSLAVLDRLSYKNRIKGKYLECDNDSEDF